MTQNDDTNNSRIDTIGRAIATAKEYNPIEVVGTWFMRTFGPLGMAVVFAMGSAAAFYRVVDFVRVVDSLTTADLAFRLVSTTIILVFGLVFAFLAIVNVHSWRHNESECPK